MDDQADIQGFLRRLRQALEARSMSQSDLARQLGVRAATVSDWFNQDRIPSGLVMLRLPNVLAVNPGWLFSGEGPLDPVSSSSPDGGSPEERSSAAVVRELRSLLDELQEQVDGQGRSARSD